MILVEFYLKNEYMRSTGQESILTGKSPWNGKDAKCIEIHVILKN